MSEEVPDFRKGDLLVGSATLADPNFRQTVVLICEHTEKSGTYGLVLNRALPVPEDVAERLAFMTGRLFQGGPVQPEVLQMLHPFGDRLEQSFEVVPGLWIGGQMEDLEKGILLGTVAPERCRFYLGYSGWAAGQLDREFQEGVWLVIRGTVDLVLGTPPDKLWSRAARIHGAANPLYAHCPDDPSWN